MQTSQPNDGDLLEQVRQLYRNANASEVVTERLLKATNGRTAPIFVCYNGVAKCLLASFKINPYTKLKLVKEGSGQMDTAVSLQSNDIELRILRLSVEYSMPSFLGYSKHVQQDKEFLQQNYDPEHPLRDVIDHFLKLLS
ncbi:hypothetical protein RCL1_007619 [Eukaryota sp. TZLM3-RCL]